MIITFPTIVSKMWVTLAFYLTHFSTFVEFHVAHSEKAGARVFEFII